MKNIKLKNYSQNSMKALSILIVLLSITSTLPAQIPTDAGKVKIKWESNLSGDFSFKEQWNYNENIFRNESGQLVCDGFCPSEIDDMLDEEGRIYPDRWNEYYFWVDTTHYHYTAQFDKWDWIDSLWYVTAFHEPNCDTVTCFSSLGVSTYSQLYTSIIGDYFIPVIKLNSVEPVPEQIFPCVGGTVIIDKNLFKKDTLKAMFDLQFEDKIYTGQLFTWKGRIYTPVSPPPPPAFEEDGSNSDQQCYHNGKLNAGTRRNIYPFNKAKKVKIISYHSDYDATPIENDTIKTSQIIEEITLSKKQIDQLTDILYNYNYSFETRYFMKSYSCYYPNHSIIFLDNSDKVISYIELSFECNEVRSALPVTSTGAFCDGKYDLLKAFFLSAGITHFYDKQNNTFLPD